MCTACATSSLPVPDSPSNRGNAAGHAFQGGQAEGFQVAGQQQHVGLRRRHPRNLLQHALERSGAPDQFTFRRGTGAAHGMDHLDEILDPAIGVENRRQFHVHMFFAARRVMDVQHAMRLATVQAAPQRAGFALLVAGLGKMVRNLMAMPPDHRQISFVVMLQVGAIGAEYGVAAIQHDARLGQGIEEGHQLD